MEWRKQYMDVILVPIGFIIMLAYHLHLLYRCIKVPNSTVIGYENNCRKLWVKRMLEVNLNDRGQCFGVISSTISASTFLASTSLTLGSIIGTWVASSSETNIFKLSMIYGDTSSSTISIKYVSILCCFLVAFTSFLQCSRNFVHANFLLSMPNSDVPAEYVQKAVMRGTFCWSIGLRAIYFASTLMLWIFGPIPFFVSCVVLVVALHFLDRKTSGETHNIPPLSSKKSHNMLKKIGEEIVGAVGHHHHQHEQRSHGNGNDLLSDVQPPPPPAVIM